MKTELKLSILGILLMYTVLPLALIIAEFFTKSILVCIYLIIQFILGSFLLIKNSKDL